MSHPNELTGHSLYHWAERAVSELSERRAEINELNVFPVPDADTGSNMTHTMEAALAAATELGDTQRADRAAVARALAAGSVRGARGNSGVVLSQVLRGVSQAIREDDFSAATLADSLSIAVQLVDQAITDPVEGTVVTVLRSAAISAQEEVAGGGDLTAVVEAAVASARVALAKTPSQLEVLREAGVVDAGGAGFLILMEALLAELSHTAYTPAVLNAVPSHGVPGALEVMFLLVAEDSVVDKLESALAALGDSLLVARGEGEAHFHIHTEDAGAVIAVAYEHGRVTDLRLEILPANTSAANPARILVALTPPGAVAELYRSAGAEVVEVPTRGAGESEILNQVVSVIRKTRAGEIVLLPNGMLNRRQLASVDNSTRAFEQSITLLPTSRLVSGIAAVAIHDAAQPLATATYAMSEAASAMRTAVLYRAQKASLTPAGPCARGDVVVEAHGEILLIADSIGDAVEAAARRLLDAGGEQVMALVDGDVDEELLSARLGVEVAVLDGGGLAATGTIAEIGVE